MLVDLRTIRYLVFFTASVKLIAYWRTFILVILIGIVKLINITFKKFFFSICHVWVLVETYHSIHCNRRFANTLILITLRLWWKSQRIDHMTYRHLSVIDILSIDVFKLILSLTTHLLRIYTYTLVWHLLILPQTVWTRLLIKRELVLDGLLDISIMHARCNQRITKCIMLVIVSTYTSWDVLNEVLLWLAVHLMTHLHWLPHKLIRTLIQIRIKIW